MSITLIVILAVLTCGMFGVDGFSIERLQLLNYRRCTEVEDGYAKHDGTSSCVDIYTDAACTNEKWLDGDTKYTVGRYTFSLSTDFKVCNKGAERREAEQRAAELIAEEKRAAERLAEEKRAAEQHAKEERVAKQRAVEQRAAEERAAKQRAAEQRVAKRRATEIKKFTIVGIGAGLLLLPAVLLPLWLCKKCCINGKLDN